MVNAWEFESFSGDYLKILTEKKIETSWIWIFCGYILGTAASPPPQVHTLQGGGVHPPHFPDFFQPFQTAAPTGNF